MTPVEAHIGLRNKRNPGSREIPLCRPITRSLVLSGEPAADAAAITLKESALTSGDARASSCSKVPRRSRSTRPQSPRQRQTDLSDGPPDGGRAADTGSRFTSTAADLNFGRPDGQRGRSGAGDTGSNLDVGVGVHELRR